MNLLQSAKSQGARSDAKTISILWSNSWCRFLDGELVHYYEERAKSPFLNLVVNF